MLEGTKSVATAQIHKMSGQPVVKLKSIRLFLLRCFKNPSGIPNEQRSACATHKSKGAAGTDPSAHLSIHIQIELESRDRLR